MVTNVLEVHLKTSLLHECLQNVLLGRSKHSFGLVSAVVLIP